MSFNLLEAVKGYFNSDLISKAASLLGENESDIAKALGGILPAVLQGIAAKSGTSSGAEEVAAMAKESHSSGLLNNIGEIFSNGSLLARGMDIIKDLFGEKAGSITDGIASFAGIRSSSAGSLMGVAAPVTLGVIGEHAGENNLGASGISALLASTKKSLAGSLPAGIGSLAGAGEEHVVTPAAAHAAGAAHNYADDGPDHAAGGVRWLTPLLLLAVLGFLAWWLLNSQSCSKKMAPHGDEHSTAGAHDKKDTGTAHDHGTTTMPAQPVVKVDSTGLATYELGREVEFDLGNGVKIMAAEHGFEAQLLDFIKHGTIDSVNKNANWLSMFDVQFKSGGNTYMGKAEAQVKNCAAILKAYPNVKIKLGGYTDNTGAADVNKRVSQQRADKVKADLLKWGVAAGQIVEAVGYGPEYPVCAANDTPECKARNRRVDCKVAAK